MSKVDTLNKYLYIPRSPYFFRVLGLMGFVSTLFAAYGFTRFFNLSLWYWLIFGPIAVIFIYNRLVRYGLQIFYPRFDIKKHEEFVYSFWKQHPEPSVDVFLPWAGEGLHIFEEVLAGVKNLDYKNLQIFILDDKGEDSVRQLADKYNFIYLSRPNKGEYRKAGNLQYGYDNSSGEFVFVLDADFVPCADSLKHLIPYICSNEKIGILQTPQYFDQSKDVHKRSIVEFGGGNVVEEFYKMDMPSRDRFKAALCVGTSAVYRRKAVLEVGGTPKTWGTEDVKQGLLITRAGYCVKYLPLILSIGRSPETLQGYFRQHNRWCTGSTETMLAGYFKKANLSLIARMIYLSNASHYLTEATSVIFSFHLLTLLYFHHDTLRLMNIIWFLPYLLYSHVILPKFRIHKYRFGTRIAAYSHIFTYLYTIPYVPFKKILPWTPAGIKIHKVQKEYTQAINLGMVFATIFFSCLIYTLLTKPQILANYNTYPLLFWSFFTAFWYAIFLTLGANHIRVTHLESALESEAKLWEKLFLHARTFFMPALSVILISLFAWVGNMALHAPNTPTSLAVTRLFNQPKVAAFATSNPTFEILNYEKSVKNSEFIDLKLEPGDSPTKISRKAIDQFLADSNIKLSKKQRIYAEDSLRFEIDIHLVSPYKENTFISIKRGLVEEYVSYASSKLHNI